MSCTWPAAPAKPLLNPDSVHVWCGVDDQAQDDEMLMEVLSDDERSRAKRYHFVRDRRWFVVRRYMLRSILSDYLGISPPAIEFAEGVHGKPRCRTRADCSRIEFSVSHSNGVVLCAVSAARCVGVDVEFVRPVTPVDQIADRVCSAEELAAFARLPMPFRERAFFELWARKEACVKACGVGLSVALDAFTVSFGDGALRTVRLPFAPTDASRVWSILALNPAPGFEAALCVEGAEPEVAYWRYKMSADDPPLRGVAFRHDDQFSR